MVAIQDLFVQWTNEWNLRIFLNYPTPNLSVCLDLQRNRLNIKQTKLGISLAVQWLRLRPRFHCRGGGRVRSMVGELRSCVPIKNLKKANKTHQETELYSDTWKQVHEFQNYLDISGCVVRLWAMFLHSFLKQKCNLNCESTSVMKIKNQNWDVPQRIHLTVAPEKFSLLKAYVALM